MADELTEVEALAEEPRIDLSCDIERFAAMGALGTLLADHSTNGNIVWATTVFEERGNGYAPTDEITTPSITGDNIGIVRTRAQKAQEEQAALTKAHAEVFTPTWVCKMMIDAADDAWFEDRDDPTWKDYATSRRLEITCGEAPYLVNRYDAADGSYVPVAERCGILDRKLRQISRHVRTRKSWMRWALAALKSTYGYEFQGDNLLIARINVLCSLEDHAAAAGYAPFTMAEYEELARVVSWNLWQMDGLSDCVPHGAMERDDATLRLPGFDDLFGFEGEPQLTLGIKLGRGAASIFDWDNGFELEFERLKREDTGMKFDYIIGNPPYQDESNGESRNYAPPIYHLFMDECFQVGDTVELIHPARFLFNAGSTPKKWNEKMLNDPHFKVLYYEEDGHKVFPTLSTPLRGGVAVTYWDKNKEFGAIQAFTKFPEVNDILHKVITGENYVSLTTIVYSRTSYRLTDAMHRDYPSAINKVSKGHAYDMSSNILQLLPEVFHDTEPNDGHDYIRVLGRLSSKRLYKFIRREYVKPAAHLDYYKVYVAQANGSGEFGETMSTPVVEGPGVAATETFLSIGCFENEEPAEAVSKYIRTKFARALLSVLKVTQNGNKPVWKMIPLQDFTSSSDIDWSQSVADIDRQLYAKYGLTDEEIDFIETHVKEMS